MESVKLKKSLPNVLTFCNMTLGLIIIFTMIHNDSLHATRLACCLVYLATILDCLDGYLARRLDAVTDMGRQLDSFADIITFGVAPVTIFLANLGHIPWFIMILLILYVLSGAFRLARYNLQESCGYFIGLPITMSGFILVTALLINSYLKQEFTKSFLVFLFITYLAFIYYDGKQISCKPSTKKIVLFLMIYI